MAKLPSCAYRFYMSDVATGRKKQLDARLQTSAAGDQEEQRSGDDLSHLRDESGDDVRTNHHHKDERYTPQLFADSNTFGFLSI